jgi:thiol-disulfide isomerase/thioredoxin
MQFKIIWPASYINFILSLFFVSYSYANAGNSFSDSTKLRSGYWRAEILRVDGHPITFNFKVQDRSGNSIIYIMNGSERLLVDQVRQSGDSVFIDMPFFDSHFALRIQDQYRLEGNWIKYFGNRQVLVPFRAVHQNTASNRFIPGRTPTYNISGRWSVLFTGAKESTLAVGEFKQSGRLVTGTFLTITGDYRFLEGSVDGDSLRLSTFDGGHAYSFESHILDSNKMTGVFYSGASSVETWVADKNEEAKLPDEYSQTALRDSSHAIPHFKFPDLSGRLVSISDPEFKNKVVIIQILGSWCPNCMDETRFLSPWYIQNKSRGVEVLGLAYERSESFADTKKLLQPFVTRFNVTYPILATGVLTGDSLRTEKTIPELQKIVGFPTTIFLDRKGMIRKIHTGFNGPGTGEHYDSFKKEFNELVNSLLAE